MKRLKSSIFLLLLLSAAVLIIYHWQLIGYGLMQAKGQYKVLSEAKPLASFIDDPTCPDSLKVKIKQLQRIKLYAKEVFALPASDQYETLFDQKGQDVLWVITASEPYAIKDYLWTFPFLGKVSYKGFFEYERAMQAFAEMDNKGFDVRLRPVSAWSTLGWFDDPILSKALLQPEPQLAELVFHELIHDVVYLKDSTTFNENLATFISRELTLIYLREIGLPIQEKQAYINSLSDRALINDFMIGYLHKFDSLYSAVALEELGVKEFHKGVLFKQLTEALDTLPFKNTLLKHSMFKDTSLNNAHILAYERYGGLQELLRKQFLQEFDGDIQGMLTFYRNM